ncbi:MAG: hypothetical protein AB1815_10340 [Bacillota bacterium]
MFKIKDRILLGLVSSLIAGVMPKIINHIEYTVDLDKRMQTHRTVSLQPYFVLILQ